MIARNLKSAFLLAMTTAAALAATGCDRGMIGALGGDDGDYSLVRSLTADGFQGKKYYLGWGAAGQGDPSMMHNEVKYDVLHTHDVFANKIGGNYIATKETGSQVDSDLIQNHWQRIKSEMKTDDMYVQYSSGHGYEEGLGVGLSYREIRDNALSLPVKETVLFTMACHSGGLVNSFKEKQAKLDEMKAAGRVLFVMSSSTVEQLSSTGPGVDDEESGPDGSAGSAFGHALWKSLAGKADGSVDGVKDGFIDLSEVEAYTKKRTEEIGGHNPVSIGFNYQFLIMNEVPGATYLSGLEGGTDAMTDDQIRSSASSLERSMAAD